MHGRPGAESIWFGPNQPCFILTKIDHPLHHHCQHDCMHSSEGMRAHFTLLSANFLFKFLVCISTTHDRGSRAPSQ